MNLCLQEGEPVGSSILQLVVTDRDTPSNGPPFSFHIVSGDEERRFHVDQGGLLSLSAPLRKGVKARHRLKIQVGSSDSPPPSPPVPAGGVFRLMLALSNQVTDSGHPPLSSICVVDISVTEQSRYPPSVVPLEVFISTSRGLVASQVIGRLQASDQDLQDVLAFKLVSEGPAEGGFSIGPSDGTIWADGSLGEGFYSLNVSVTDGKFTVWTGVRVHVWTAEQRLLDAGLSLQLVGLSPEEFLGDRWRGLQRSLGQALGVPRQEVHLASLQQLQDSTDLEALLVWRSQTGPAQPLLPNRLAGEPVRPQIISRL